MVMHDFHTKKDITVEPTHGYSNCRMLESSRHTVIICGKVDFQHFILYKKFRSTLLWTFFVNEKLEICF